MPTALAIPPHAKATAGRPTTVAGAASPTRWAPRSASRAAFCQTAARVPPATRARRAGARMARAQRRPRDHLPEEKEPDARRRYADFRFASILLAADRNRTRSCEGSLALSRAPGADHA